MTTQNQLKVACQCDIKTYLAPKPRQHKALQKTKALFSPDHVGCLPGVRALQLPLFIPPLYLYRGGIFLIFNQSQNKNYNNEDEEPMHYNGPRFSSSA
jgi:hypothetical protein